MEIINHRANTLDKINLKFGLEIDVRDFNNNLVLSHDQANNQSILLSSYLKEVNPDQLLAINIKSTEIEDDLYSILNEFKISNYFTFDWSIPSLVKALTKNLFCAFRLSEYEKDIIPGCDWVWIDSFEEIWYDTEFITSLKKHGLKIALVSPELHGREFDLKQVKDIVNSVRVDAICTDLPNFWLND